VTAKQLPSRPTARPWASRPHPCCSERGAAMLATMALMVVVLLVGVALFTLGTAESELVDYTGDGREAFWLAEAGLERARAWLAEMYASDPGYDPVGTEVAGQPLGEGDYTFRVIAGGGGAAPAYVVESDGVVDGVLRRVRATFTAESLARYQWLIDSQAPDTWMKTGDNFEGPVHMNGHLRIDGDPWFGAKVTASGDYIEKPDSDPTFTQEYETGVPEVAFPNLSAVEASLRAAAISDGLYGPALSGSDYYEVEMGRTGAGMLSYRINGSATTNWVDVDITSLEGAAWFDSEVRVKGVIDGELTIGCSEDLYISGDILFYGSTPGSGPDPGCNDPFGIIGAENVYVADTPDNSSDCEIHGVIMALDRRFQVEDWNKAPSRGTLTIWGGIIADQAWRINTFVGSTLRSGYLRDFHYDGRMTSIFPPFFPMTGRFLMTSWQEVMPPEV